MKQDKMQKKIMDLIRQWDKLHPDHELVVISLPKYDKTQRKAHIQAIAAMLEREDYGDRPLCCQ
jgi:hypothetical protein